MIYKTLHRKQEIAQRPTPRSSGQHTGAPENTQELQNGKHFLLHQWYPSCCSSNDIHHLITSVLSHAHLRTASCTELLDIYSCNRIGGIQRAAFNHPLQNINVRSKHVGNLQQTSSNQIVCLHIFLEILQKQKMQNHTRGISI